MYRAEGSATHRVGLQTSILLACLVRVCVSLEGSQLAGVRTTHGAREPSTDLDIRHGDSELRSEARGLGEDRPKLTGFSELQFLGNGTSERAKEADDVFLWTVGNVTKPERSPSNKIRFQRDFPGVKGIQGSVLGPFTGADPNLVAWLATTPVVLCSDDVMFFTASGEGLAHLLVDREGAPPISLLHLPSYCGYSVKSLSEDLQVLAAYDACYITQENGSYVLPMLWSGSPLKLSCPMEMPTPVPSPIAPSVFCSPYGMAVQIYEKEEDIPLLGVIVNGDWVPFVSAECAYRINSEPEDFIFFIPFMAPCATVKAEVYIQLVSQQEYILLCPVPPELVHPPHFPQHPTPEPPQVPYPPVAPAAPSIVHHSYPESQYSQLAQILPPGQQPITSPLPIVGSPPGPQPLPVTQRPSSPKLPPAPSKYPVAESPIIQTLQTPPAPTEVGHHPQINLQEPYFYGPTSPKLPPAPSKYPVAESPIIQTLQTPPALTEVGHHPQIDLQEPYFYGPTSPKLPPAPSKYPVAESPIIQTLQTPPAPTEVGHHPQINLQEPYFYGPTSPKLPPAPSKYPVAESPIIQTLQTPPAPTELGHHPQINLQEPYFYGPTSPKLPPAPSKYPVAESPIIQTLQTPPAPTEVGHHPQINLQEPYFYGPTSPKLPPAPSKYPAAESPIIQTLQTPPAPTELGHHPQIDLQKPYFYGPTSPKLPPAPSKYPAAESPIIQTLQTPPAPTELGHHPQINLQEPYFYGPTSPKLPPAPSKYPAAESPIIHTLQTPPVPTELGHPQQVDLKEPYFFQPTAPKLPAAPSKHPAAESPTIDLQEPYIFVLNVAQETQTPISSNPSSHYLLPLHGPLDLQSPVTEFKPINSQNLYDLHVNQQKPGVYIKPPTSLEPPVTPSPKEPENINPGSLYNTNMPLYVPIPTPFPDQNTQYPPPLVSQHQNCLTQTVCFYQLVDSLPYHEQSPLVPDMPSLSYQPVPQVPSIPEYPSITQVTSLPEYPSVPKVPSIPEYSSAPKVPSIPENLPATKVPSIPENLLAIKVPSIPEKPSTPKVPSTPEHQPVPQKPSLLESPLVPQVTSVPEQEPVTKAPSLPEYPTVPQAVSEPEHQLQVPSITKYPKVPQVTSVPEHQVVPEMPSIPEYPSVPQVPYFLDYLSVPHAPYFPQYLSVPQVPYFPDYSSVPHGPYFPENPLLPLVPSFPESPLVPSVPKHPSVPQAPSIPVLPSVTSIPEVQSVSHEQLSLDYAEYPMITEEMTTITSDPEVSALSPHLKCLSDKMFVFLPFAHPDSIQVTDKQNWLYISGVSPQCQYMIQMSQGAGVNFHSPLPACHSHLESPNIVSLPVRFFNVYTEEYQSLDLQCPHISPTPPSVSPPTTPPPSVIPKPKVSCTSHQMIVELPPGPVSGISIKDVEGNLINLKDAPNYCGYSASKGQDGKIHLSLQLQSTCHMNVEGKMYSITVGYMTDEGAQEARLSCPAPVSGTGRECDLPSEKQLKCGPAFPSQSFCLAMGCCFSKTSRACYYPMDECTLDRHFVFSVPAALTDPPLTPALLVAASNFTCTPEVVTSDYAMFKIPMDGCGVRRVVVGKTMIYMLEVINKVQTISLNYGTITRDSPVRLLVECRYVPGSALTVSYLVKTPSLGPAVQTQGLFGVQLRIAKDAEYSSYHPQYHQPLQMLLGKPLYLELRLLNAPDPSLVLLVHYCVAYPRSGKAVWVLLYNGCPNPLDPAAQQSVLLEPRPPYPQSQTRRFTVSTFQFLPDREFKDAEEEIYFMCSTEICSPRDGPCVEGCFGR